MKDWACKSIGEVVNERDAALERCETMREALNSCLSCFIELKAYDDKFYERLPFSIEQIEAALKGNQ